MFELSVALKYLVPRWRQLSVSLISLISILVIALVVWLVVVFFSVTNGLEKSWVQKLITLTAPIRITPTPAYYRSYYYQIDSVSSSSNYAHKSIHEKLIAEQTDPYDPYTDQEPHSGWIAARTPKGQLIDLVKEAVQIAQKQNLSISDFEIASANLRLEMHNPKEKGSTINQAVFLGPFDQESNLLQTTLIPLSAFDRERLFRLTGQKLSNDTHALPSNSRLGEPILLPRSFREAGLLTGDSGYLSYYIATASSMQEQRLPVFVAGFYDPGIIPIGGKFVLVPSSIVDIIRGSYDASEGFSGNGFNIRFDNLEEAGKIKEQLQKEFDEAGISPYWKIETFREFDFTKDLLQQLRSEKNLWTLLATVIIIVACSNIVSMLIILVNDKKLEIGILRSMGATSFSIGLIFGICGLIMGMLGSIIGMVVAILTLYNLQTLVNVIGHIQGFQMFNPLFYGNTLPNELSFEAILFVVVTTTAISIFAGIVPAIKASLLRPSIILRSE